MLLVPDLIVIFALIYRYPFLRVKNEDQRLARIETSRSIDKKTLKQQEQYLKLLTLHILWLYVS